MKKREIRSKPPSRTNWFGLALLGLFAFVAAEIAWMVIARPKPDVVINPVTEVPVYIPQIAESAKPLIGDLEIAALYAAVEPKLAEYRLFRDMVVALGHRYRINVILQTHAATIAQDPGGTGNELASQRGILRILKHLKPKVLVLEGHDRIVLTPHSLRQAFLDDRAKRNINVRSGEAERFVEHLVNAEGGLSYAFTAATCRAVGIEDADLYNLSAEVIRRRIALQPDPAEPPTDAGLDTLYSRLQYDLGYTRALIAFGLAVEHLHKTERSMATIVIGSGHRDQVEEIMQSYRIRGAIYDTTSP